MGHINVLLVDDHNIVKQGLRAILDSHPSITVVSEASDGKEAIEKLEGSLDVNFVIIDINMPVMNPLSLPQN